MPLAESKQDVVHEQLREHLNSLRAVGFPAVPGVDIPCLKKLFSVEQARVFLALEDRFQPVIGA